jgi:hypothetical protein
MPVILPDDVIGGLAADTRIRLRDHDDDAKGEL